MCSADHFLVFSAELEWTHTQTNHILTDLCHLKKEVKKKKILKEKKRTSTIKLIYYICLTFFSFLKPFLSQPQCGSASYKFCYFEDVFCLTVFISTCVTLQIWPL